MARVQVFADEAGNFDFSGKRGASRYFILTTATVRDHAICDSLLALRRQLAWEGVEQASDDFHATEERQEVRDRVFEVLGALDIRVDASIFYKRNVMPHLQADEHRFYKQVWYLHFKHLAPRILSAGDELLVVAASVGTKKLRGKYRAGVEDVVAQCVSGIKAQTHCWSAASDPCLWIADWCCWAIQRRWELEDERSHILIKSRIQSEFAFFR